MTDQRTRNKILALFSTLSLLMGVVCNMTIPVSAYPSVDTSVASFSSFYYYTGQNTYSMTDASTSNEIKIPLYCMYFGSDSPDESYLNGYIRTSLPGYIFSFNGSSIAPSYFEVDPAQGLSCSSPTANSNSMTIYFDNHLKQNNFYFILGYYVFNFSEYTTLSITITPGAGLVQRDPSVTTLYSSTSEFGLAQAIVTAINNSSDIDSIISVLNHLDSTTLQSVISGISSNTNLLTLIYQRLGQMQTANSQFYSDIDNIIDTVTWNNVTSSFDLSGSSLSSLDNNFNKFNPLYMKFTIGSFDGLLHLRLNVRSNITSSRNSLTPIYIGRGTTYNLINSSEIYIFSFNGNFIDLYINNFVYGDLYVGIKNEFNTSISVLSYNLLTSEYISSNDIEYWNIIASLRTYKLMNLLDSYINANISDPVDHAATQAAGLAQNQAAAEQSLAALSPADMGDFDSAVSDITILDDVSNSLVFWTNAVHAFSTRSGSLWGVFIFGLLIGLIAFILRLRR